MTTMNKEPQFHDIRTGAPVGYWKLTIHKWDGQSWAEEIIEGPSPSFNLAIGEHVSTRWHFQDVSIFPQLLQAHVWLTPVWEKPETPLHPKSLEKKRA